MHRTTVSLVISPVLPLEVSFLVCWQLPLWWSTCRKTEELLTPEDGGGKLELLSKVGRIPTGGYLWVTRITGREGEKEVVSTFGFLKVGCIWLAVMFLQRLVSRLLALSATSLICSAYNSCFCCYHRKKNYSFQAFISSLLPIILKFQSVWPLY